MSSNMYLIVGPSGSGKTTLANNLSQFFELKQVQSYTTRPQRYEGESGHVFLTDEEFDALEDLVAFTEFDGYRYAVTQKEIDESDIYVIDPFGVMTLMNYYHGDKNLIVMYLDVTEEECRERMLNRGDDPETVERRILHDREIFRGGYPLITKMIKKWHKYRFDTLLSDDSVGWRLTLVS